MEHQNELMFWNRVFQTNDDNGKVKLKLLPKIIKPLLCLSHGNADLERGFSINKRLITSDRSSLSEMSINGLRTVEDVICRCCGVMNVKVTSAMLKAARNAASMHRQRLEAEKQKLEKDAES